MSAALAKRPLPELPAHAGRHFLGGDSIRVIWRARQRLLGFWPDTPDFIGTAIDLGWALRKPLGPTARRRVAEALEDVKRSAAATRSGNPDRAEGMAIRAELLLAAVVLANAQMWGQDDE